MAWWSWFVNLLGTSQQRAMTIATPTASMPMPTGYLDWAVAMKAGASASMPMPMPTGYLDWAVAMETGASTASMPMPTGYLDWAVAIEAGASMATPTGSLHSGGESQFLTSIFRVPNFLKQSTKRGAYVPKIVSLGPYHHRNAKLLAMEKHKEKARSRMKTRFMSIKPNNDSESMDFSSRAEKEILNLNDKIRRSYEEEIGCEKEELARMLCLDGCFILEILRTLGGHKLRGEGASNCYEPIFEKNRIDYTGFDILNDILKLENQVPLIVLRKLLQLELISNDVNGNLFTWHLLGLLHRLIVSAPCSHVGDRAANAVKRIPRAGKLKNAGIKFKTCDAGISKIRFEPESGTIYLPGIYVTDHTEVLFRNLIAFEVCKASETNYVTCYVTLMDELIDLEEDVGVLKESGILTNCLGSDAEVAKLFNGL